MERILFKKGRVIGEGISIEPERHDLLFVLESFVIKIAATARFLVTTLQPAFGPVGV